MSTRSSTTSAAQQWLVGFDGSAAATKAIEWAGRLGRLAEAELIVARMFTPAEAEVNPEHYDELQRRAEYELQCVASEVLDPLDVPYRTLLEAGTADGLLRIGDEVHADLIAIGPRGQGGFAALHVGSTAHHLAHRAERPLAIVPSFRADTSFERIVVGIDASAGSSAAVDWCTDLAVSTGAEVIAVYSFEPFLEWVPRSDPTSIWQSIERDVESATSKMSSRDVNVRTEIVKDIHPVAAIASVVEREKAGLAVVGRRGRGGFAGLVLGRVPEQLVHHAHVPVVVVPSRPGEGDEGA